MLKLRKSLAFLFELVGPGLDIGRSRNNPRTV